MKKHCYCCGKEVKFLDNMDLANGKICTDCYEKVHKIDDSISWRNTFNYNGEYIKQLIELNEGIITQITAEPHLETIENKQEVDIKKEDNTQEAAKPKIKPMVEKLKKTRKTIWKKIKKSKKIIICVFVIAVVIIGMLIPVNNYFNTKKSAIENADNLLSKTQLNKHLDNVSEALRFLDIYEEKYSSSYEYYDYLPEELRAENVYERRCLEIAAELYDNYATLRKKYSNVEVTAEDYDEINKLYNCVHSICLNFPDGMNYKNKNGNAATLKVTDELKTYHEKIGVLVGKLAKLQPKEMEEDSSTTSSATSKKATDFEIIGGSSGVYIISSKNYGFVCPYCGYDGGALGTSYILSTVSDYTSGETATIDGSFMCASAYQGGCRKSSKYTLNVKFR